MNRFLAATAYSILISILVPSASTAQLTGGVWVPAPGSLATYCADQVCSQELADATITLQSSPELGLYQSLLLIELAPSGVDIFVEIGRTFSIEDLPFQGESSTQQWVLTYHYLEPELIVLDGLWSADGFPGLGPLEVQFEDVEFVPVPEPSALLMLAIGLLALAILSSRSRPA